MKLIIFVAELNNRVIECFFFVVLLFVIHCKTVGEGIREKNINLVKHVKTL